jgi:hypothetical protein
LSNVPEATIEKPFVVSVTPGSIVMLAPKISAVRAVEVEKVTEESAGMSATDACSRSPDTLGVEVRIASTRIPTTPGADNSASSRQFVGKPNNFCTGNRRARDKPPYEENPGYRRRMAG